jgi:muconate cycloisomerase
MIPDTIESMAVHLVRWPLRMKRRHGVGDIEHAMPGVVLKLVTREGRVGWGEAAPWSVFSGIAEGCAQALNVYLRPLVVGAQPGQLPRLMAAADRALVGHAEAKAALEMAVLDLIGQASGLRVAELLGGVYRESIPLSVSIANPDFDEDLEFARLQLARGVRLFKVKTGFASHREDLQRLERLKAVLPADAELRVDYNQGLDPWDALPKLRDIEAFAPGFIEQPVPRDRRDAMAEIARALDTPLLADESVFTPAEAIELARARFADCVSIKLMKCGGMRPAQAIASIAQAAGIAGYGGTMYEGGIAISAGIHTVCATPNICLGAEFYTSAYVLGVEILREPVRLDGGASHLPPGPGLGIAIDEAALASITTQQWA